MSIEILVAHWSQYKIEPASRVSCILVGPHIEKLPHPGFVWRGVATKDAASNAARHAAQLTLKTLEKFEGRESPLCDELSQSYITMVPLPNSRASGGDLTHSISVVGEPFIPADSDEESFCFDAAGSGYIPDEGDYARAVEVKDSITRILMIDPVVKRLAIFGGRQIKVQFSATVEVYRGADGRRLPSREVGFNIRDKEGMPIQIREETANAILMMMLRLRGTSRSWELFQPSTLPVRIASDDVGLSFCFELMEILDRPTTQLADSIWWLTSLGHLELTEHIVRMAEDRPDYIK